MGLDVYLYKYDDLAAYREAEAKYSQYIDSLWANREYKSIPEDEKEEIRKKTKEYALSLGLNEDGYNGKGVEKVELDSTIDKAHMFKIGYFRSSYNEGGLERIASNFGIYGLKDIFQPSKDSTFQPDWKDALVRVNIAIEQWKKADVGIGITKVFDKNYGHVAQPKCEKEALDLFLSEKAKNKDNPYNFSSGTGEFFMKEPMKVLAIISGNSEYIFNTRECQYIIYENPHGYKWYITALEIVKETIEHVLAQSDINKYYICWSG